MELSYRQSNSAPALVVAETPPTPLLGPWSPRGDSPPPVAARRVVI